VWGRFLEVLQSGIPRRRRLPRNEVYPGLTRGMVIAVYADADPTQDRYSPRQVLCDVLLSRGGIVRAPVAQRGSAVNNVDRWVPSAARTNMATGAAVKLTNDGLAPAPTHLEDLDGDLVLVDWIERDLHRPIVLCSLEHPRRARATLARYEAPVVAEGVGYAPRSHSELLERFVAHQGTTVRVDRAGNVRVDLRRAGVANDGTTFDAPSEASGMVDVALRKAAEVVVRGEDGVPLARIKALPDGHVELALGRTTAEYVLLAGPTLAHLTLWQAALAAAEARWSDLFQLVAAAAAVADATQQPAPLSIPPGADLLCGPWAWQTPPLGEAVGDTLRSASVRVAARTVAEAEGA